MTGNGWIVLVVGLFVLFCCIFQGYSLRCPKCEHIQVSSTGALQNAFNGKTNPNCGDTLNVGTVPYEDCPSDSNYRCSYSSGTVTASLFVGSVSAKIHIRRCLLVPSGTPNGCLDKQHAKTAINTFLSFVQGISNVQLDGDVCFCNIDFCDAGTCSSGIKILGFCMVWYIWLGAAVGLIVFLLLATCCCCCCCKPCKKSQVGGGQVLQQQPGTAVVMVPHGQGLPQMGLSTQYPATQDYTSAGYNQQTKMM